MAETVEEELNRKLASAAKALSEVEAHIARYTEEQKILVKRVKDLQTALSVFTPEELDL